MSDNKDTVRVNHSITKSLRERMRPYDAGVNWSRVVRDAIARELDRMEAEDCRDGAVEVWTEI